MRWQHPESKISAQETQNTRQGPEQRTTRETIMIIMVTHLSVDFSPKLSRELLNSDVQQGHVALHVGQAQGCKELIACQAAIAIIVHHLEELLNPHELLP